MPPDSSSSCNDDASTETFDWNSYTPAFRAQYEAFVKRRAQRVAAGDIPKVFSYDEYRKKRLADPNAR